MKPRLEVTPLTEEDKWIRWRGGPVLTAYAYSRLCLLSDHSDRRDADLMLRIEQCRAAEIAETVDHQPHSRKAYAHSMLHARELLGIGGDDPFDITNFA